MERKVYLWVALILGVPLIRVLEVYSVGQFLPGLSMAAILSHAFLGLIIGTGCAFSVQLLRLSGRQILWVLPLLALGYATLLLGVTYPRSFFRLDATFVSDTLLLDLGSWFIAVAGAATIGYVATKPRLVPQIGVTRPQ